MATVFPELLLPDRLYADCRSAGPKPLGLTLGFAVPDPLAVFSGWVDDCPVVVLSPAAPHLYRLYRVEPRDSEPCPEMQAPDRPVHSLSGWDRIPTGLPLIVRRSRLLCQHHPGTS